MRGIDDQQRAAMWVEDSGGKMAVFDEDKQMKATMQSESLGGLINVISAGFPQVILRADWDGGQVLVNGRNERPSAILSITDPGDEDDENDDDENDEDEDR